MNPRLHQVVGPLAQPVKAPPQAASRIGPVDDPLEREAERKADAWVPLHSAQAMPDATSAAKQQKPDNAMPLTTAQRTYFEPRIGTTLDDVRLHAGPQAARSAGAMDARAFTVANDISFAEGAYKPDTSTGQHLLAHELAHVAQVRQGADPATVRRAPESEFRIVSDVWVVSDKKGTLRRVVVVEHKGERQAMYQRSGDSQRPEGHAGPQAGDWAPFDGFRKNGHFEKDIYHRGKMPNNMLHGYGDGTRLRMGEWLSKQKLPEAIPAPWNHVQLKLESLGVEVHTKLEPLAATEPVARSVSGEINAKTPPRGGGQRVVSEPSVVSTLPSSKIGSTVEGRGAPVEPIVNPANASAKAAREGGALMLLSRQLGNIRSDEAQKAQQALNNILADIQPQVTQGYGFTIKLVMEVPNTIDLAAAIVGIGDASQVVYFNRMYIETVSPPAKPLSQQENSPYPQMRANLAPGDPMQEDPHERTLDQQIRGQMGEQYPVKKYAPRDGFHFETRELQVAGQAQRVDRINQDVANNLREAAAIRANPPAYVGKFRPDKLNQESVGGEFASVVAIGMHRVLQFNALPATDPGFAQMWNTHYDTSTTRYDVESTSGTAPTSGFKALFVEKAGGKIYSYVQSELLFVSPPGTSEMLLEIVKGGETGNNARNWSALINWKRV